MIPIKAQIINRIFILIKSAIGPAIRAPIGAFTIDIV
jgi:hypothetical protein